MRRQHLYLWVGLAGIVLVLAGIMFGQDTLPWATFSDLTFEIASTKKTFLELEPIPVVLTLSNRTHSPIRGHAALEFSEGFVKLFKVDGDRRQTEIQNLALSIPQVMVEPIRLLPGSRYEERQLLYVDLESVFPKPGVYGLQAVLENIGGEERVTSNVLEINVERPTEGRDVRAFEYMKSNGGSTLFFTGPGVFSEREEKERKLNAFVTDFGDTIYGTYTGYTLGGLYLVRKQFDRAAELYRRVATRRDFEFAEEALYHLIEADAMSGHLSEADYYFEMLRDRYPKSSRVVEAERLVSQKEASER